MNKIILFDIDGTLIGKITKNFDPRPISFQEVYGTTRKMKDGESSGKTYNQIIIDVMTSCGLSEQEILAKLDVFFPILHKYYKQALEKTEAIIFDKIVELLEELKKEGYKLGLVTGNTEYVSKLKLDKGGIRKYFNFGGYGNEGINRGDLIPIALNKINYKGDNKKVIIIGDTTRDIQAGLENGCTTIGVATGKYSADELKKAGANYVLANLQNIPKVLNIIAEI